MPRPPLMIDAVLVPALDIWALIMARSTVWRGVMRRSDVNAHSKTGPSMPDKAN
jgi:hypothetical protein